MDENKSHKPQGLLSVAFAGCGVSVAGEEDV